MDHRFITLVAALATLTASVSFAHGNASHEPRPHQYVAAQVVETAFGRQGDPSKASRAFTVEMTDRMQFTPPLLALKRGETIRITAANTGQLRHELVLGTPQEIRRHSDAMKQHPGMEHDEPHMVHVAPGQQGELIWQFTKPGEFQFAGLLPGHFEAGMVGKVVVQ